jgi:dUTP pyrophosphatase
MQLNFKKLNPEAKIFPHQNLGDAGIDFCTTEKVSLGVGERKRISTGIALEIPEGHVGLIWDKSSVAINLGLKVIGGVVDSNYRGEVIIYLLNTSQTEVVLEKGQKVAQMLIQKFETCELVEINELSETIRGEGREGSNGQ